MMMNLYDPMEIVITADVTYILISHVNDSYRRILHRWTRAGRIEDEYVPTYRAIRGKWSTRTGRPHDALEIETRTCWATASTTARPPAVSQGRQHRHQSGIFLDKADNNIIYNDHVTTARWTRPWSITKRPNATRRLARSGARPSARKTNRGSRSRRTLFPERRTAS